MRGFCLWVLFAFAVVCRAALGAEGGGGAGGDPAGIFWKSLFDNGPLGLFLAYMLHRETKRDKLDAESRDADAARRREAAERFRRLDEKFIDVIEKYACDTTGVHVALRDIRAGLEQVTALLHGRPADRKER